MASEWRDSWMVVVAALFAVGLVDGTLFSFGLFLVEFLDDLGESRGSTAFIGSVGSCFCHLLGPICGSLVDKFGSRLLIVIGSLVSFTGFFASAYVKTLPIMCFTYGMIGGSGFGLMLLPANACVIKHFTKSRATACGIANCGSGIGIFIFNILTNYLISEFGWRMALLLISGIILNGIPCGIVLTSPGTKCRTKEMHHVELEGNITDSKQTNKSTCISMFDSFRHIVKDIARLVREKTTIMVVVATVFVSLALPVPFSLLPDAVIQSGMTRSDASWLVSSIGVSSIVGRLTFGWIGDKLVLYRKAILKCTWFSMGLSLAMLPLMATFQTKLIMTCLFGLSSGAYIMIVPVVLADEFGPEHIGKSFGSIMLIIGVSVLFAAPLAGWIYDVSGNYDLSFYVAGGSCCVSAIFILFFSIIYTSKGRKSTTIISTHL